jgi:hypothetical protein
MCGSPKKSNPDTPTRPPGVKFHVAVAAQLVVLGGLVLVGGLVVVLARIIVRHEVALSQWDERSPP